MLYVDSTDKFPIAIEIFSNKLVKTKLPLSFSDWTVSEIDWSWVVHNNLWNEVSHRETVWHQLITTQQWYENYSNNHPVKNKSEVKFGSPHWEVFWNIETHFHEIAVNSSSFIVHCFFATTWCQSNLYQCKEIVRPLSTHSKNTCIAYMWVCAPSHKFALWNQ